MSSLRVPQAGALPFRVLVITDAAASAQLGRGIVETVARAVLPRADGCAVLVREKDTAQPRVREHVAALCTALRPITRAAGVPLLVHTHLELVGMLGLDGAHIASDADPRAARAALGEGPLLGASRHAHHGLDEVALDGVDYVTLSPVFPPTSKRGDVRAPLGVEGLRGHAAGAARPVVALGGVDADAASLLLEAGAAAVAVIGAVMAAHHPRRALLELIDATARPRVRTARPGLDATRGTAQG